MKFIDQAKILIRSGHGGPGAISFRRESMTPRGGPDGGDGGRGGSAVVRTDAQLGTLLDFKYTRNFFAEDGHPGEGRNCSGRDGQDAILMVPPGTIVKRASTGELMADLTGDKTEVVVARGGRGGKGNAFFATSTNQAPRHAQPGEDGEEFEIILELKLLADVGIIGFPNVGKSTFISRISAAKPKIADYPFTTLVPNLGVVRAGNYKSFVVADIPGLIKGAHQGVGLGIQFLRHIERTRFFVHIVDASGMSGRDPLEDFDDINQELKEYDEINKNEEGFFPLSERRQIVALNKIDVRDKKEIEDLVKKFKKERDVEAHPISSFTGAGVDDLVRRMAKILLGDEESGIEEN